MDDLVKKWVKKMKENFCHDCGNKVSRRAGRCKSCAQKLKKRQNIKMPLRIKIDPIKLKKLYVEDKKTVREIAEIFNCYPEIIYHRLKLKKINLEERPRKGWRKIYRCIECGKEVCRVSIKRCYKCYLISRRGKSSSLFKDGSGCYRKIARENKPQLCEKCGSKRNLCVHHKNFNRENNELENLSILCRSCHAKEHKRGKNFGNKYKLRDLREGIRKLRIKYISYDSPINKQEIINDLEEIMI